MPDVTTLGIAVDSSGVVKATDNLDKLAPAGKTAAASAREVEASFREASIEGNVLGQEIAEIIKKGIELAKEFANMTLEVGRFQDLATKIGSNDPAGLASLRTAADISEVSIESVSLAIDRMAIQLLKSSDASKGAGRALDAIGIAIDDFRRLDPVAQYKLLATTLDGYADSQSKVQAIQEITGRGGAEQLVLLKNLARETDATTSLTKEQIKVASDYSDELRKSRSETQQMIAALGAQGLLPVMVAVTGAFHDYTKELFAAEGATNDLKNNKGISEWAEGGAIALSYLVDAAEWTVRGLSEVGKTIGATFALASVKADFDNLTKLLYTGQISIGQFYDKLKSLDAQQKSVVSNLWDDLTKDKGDTFGVKIRKRIEDLKSLKDVSESMKDTRGGKGLPDIDLPPLPGKQDTSAADAAEAARIAYNNLLLSIYDKIRAEKEELDQGEKLTASQRLENELNKAIRDSVVDITGAKLMKIRAAEFEAVMLMENIEAAKKAKDAEEELSKAMTKQNEELMKEIGTQQSKAAADLNQAQHAEELLDQYGKTAEQIEVLRIIKVKSLLVDIQAAKAVEDTKNGTTKLSIAYRDQIDAITRTADAMNKLAAAQKNSRENAGQGASDALDEYVKKVQDVGTATKDAVGQGLGMLEDDLTNLFHHGKLDVSNFIDFTINEFLRLAVVRPFIQNMLGGGGGGGIFSLFKGLLGGGGGAAGAMGSSGVVGAAGMDVGLAFAEGGDPPVGRTSIIGEKGPELFKPKEAGTIIPNDKINMGGGDQYTINSNPIINIDARADSAQVAQNVRMAIEQSNKQLVAELRATGALR